MTRADFMRQAAEARKTMQELARLFPGCFTADGRAGNMVGRRALHQMREVFNR